jgi:UDP-3-O-[3-hydroxymyristoyl] glucosamine N-acyltransferase
VIINRDFEAEKKIDATLIRVENAYQSFAKLLEVYNTIRRNKTGIENMSFIDPSAKYGEEIYIGAFSYVGKDVKIGNRVKIYPNSYTLATTALLVTIQHFFPVLKSIQIVLSAKRSPCMQVWLLAEMDSGSSPIRAVYQKVAQIGNVIIEDHVEIGANSTIDRATLGSSIIRKGVKLG